jgi:hypothetical protein
MGAMSQSFQQRSARALFGVGALLVSMTALGWSERATFETRIHGHQFSLVTIESGEACAVKVQVRFDAPREKYEEKYEGESPERKVYRFHVRAKLDGGRQLVTRVFSNSSPGTRTFVDTQDTSGEGCWGKQPQKLIGIDVEGCRGARCSPAVFE